MKNSRIKELSDLITQARNDYYNDQPKHSDQVFDAWCDELKKLDPKNIALTSVGAPIVPSAWKKGTHKIPMGSLDKVNTPEELSKWYADTCRDQELFVSEKLDGISIALNYEDGKLKEAITRGDGTVGEVITSNVIKMQGVPQTLPMSFTGSFRGEIILTKTNHKKYFADKANTRNAASGAAKKLDGTGSDHLSVLLYQVLGDVDLETEVEQFDFLRNVGCYTPNYQVFPINEEFGIYPDTSINTYWREYQDKDRQALDYDIDGLVVRINNLHKQAELGDTNLRPKGARAFKFDNEQAETEIKDIIWQTGNSGRVTPVAIVLPVMLVGAKVERASLYNLAYINELGLGIGAKVIVVRANDVIPRVQAVVTAPKKVATGPEKCPACEAQTRMEGENLICTDPDACPAQIAGRIKNWVKELNILELGDTLIEKLVGANLIANPADLYTLTVDQLANLDRMGKKSAQNVYDSLWKMNPVALDIFLGGLSIPMIGSSSIRLLMEAGYNNLDKIMKMTQDEMEAIKSMGPSRAESLVNGLVNNEDIIMALLDNGVKIKSQVDGKLSKKSFAFTGTLTNKRAVLEQMVLDNGGIVKSSVGKGLGYLVINDLNSTSSKAVSAKKLGTKLISEDDFLEMLK